MCLCSLCSRRFVAAAAPAATFLDYCRARCLPGTRNAADNPRMEGWRDTVTALPAGQRTTVEREADAACDLGTPEGNAHLLQAAGPGRLPPGGTASGVPLALWYLVNHPAYFWDVWHAHELRSADVWHASRAPTGFGRSGLRIAAALAGTLGALLFGHVPAAASGHVTLHDLGGGAVCAVAPPDGEDRSRRRGASRAAKAQAEGLQLAYYPQEETLLLKPPSHAGPAFALAAMGRVASELLEVPPSRSVFDLGALKMPFRPAPDATDMESVRVKTLHLRYPEREGRRLLALDTLSGDSPWSIDEMLAEHAAGDFDRLDVTHAVIQVRLAGHGGRPRNHLVRLWPDRCDLGRGALGDRMLRCLRLWGF